MLAIVFEIHTLFQYSCSLIPESPRWQLVKGKNKAAMSTLRYIGVVNGRPLPEDVEVTVQVYLVLQFIADI